MGEPCDTDWRTNWRTFDLLFTELAYAVESWVKALRDTIRDAGFRDGWSVLERRKRVQIQRTWRGPENERIRKGISTQIPWERGCTSAVLAAFDTLQRGLNHGLTLDEAYALLLVDPADERHQRMHRRAHYLIKKPAKCGRWCQS